MRKGVRGREKEKVIFESALTLKLEKI